MTHKIFSIFDNAAEAYLPPFFAVSRGFAIRIFENCIADVNHQFNKHAEDFTIFELGEWDDTNTQFTLAKTPISLGKANEYKAKIDAKRRQYQTEEFGKNIAKAITKLRPEENGVKDSLTEVEEELKTGAKNEQN